MYNNATKADLKNVTGVDTSKFAKKVNLASLKGHTYLKKLGAESYWFVQVSVTFQLTQGTKGLKSNVDKLDIDKMKNVQTNLSNFKSKVDTLDVENLVPVHLSKLSDLVKMMLLKETYIILR